MFRMCICLVRRTSLRVALACVALLALAGCAHATPGAPPALRAKSLPVSRASHVVVVLMENHELNAVIGNSDAPYVNAIARHYALAENYYAIAHPSLPNYLALTGGSTFGIDSDCLTCHVAGGGIVDQLERARISWRAYMEDMPSLCYRGDDTGGYARRHDPFMYYDAIAGDPKRCSKVVPASKLAPALLGGRLPAFVWVTPNMCDSTHDCGVNTGDRYLAGLLPPLIRELGPHGILFLTWDEGSSSAGCCGYASGGRVATIVAGPDIRRGARLTAPADHYSLLAAIDAALRLPPLGHAACPCTPSLAAAFRGGRIPHVR
jgi:hypothetical protein